MKHLRNLFKSSRGWYNYSALLILTVIVSIFYIIQMTYMNSFINTKYGRKEEAEIIFPDDDFLFFQSFKFEGEKIVHLDLKGAPPKISYLLDFIPFIKGLGASGILVEYEDMFPYHGELEKISALNAYTPSDIAAIIEAAEKNNLTIIPLVPTFSHLEFVLKLQHFKDFREVEAFPHTLCPSKKNIYPILYKMIDQVLAAHPMAKHLHIGTDEAQLIGLCTKCQLLMKKNKWKKDDLYFNHVKKLASYISTKYPKVRPILWGDKFLKQNEKIILAHQLPDFVDIMLWNYHSVKSTFPRSEDMKSYARLFKNIWIASAFKDYIYCNDLSQAIAQEISKLGFQITINLPVGARGSKKMITDPDYHLRNTMAWMKFVRQWNNEINFKGIALTGWQRFGHFSVLCELLPVGVPSLAFSLQFLNTDGGSDYDEVKQSLKCNDLVPRNLNEMLDLELISRLQCDYPGYKIYKLINLFYNSVRQLKALLKELDPGDFSFYSITHNTSNPTYVYKLNFNTFENRLIEFNTMEESIRAALNEAYDQYTVDEWVMTYIVPHRLRLEASINILSALRSRKVWPRRPVLDMAPRVKQFFNKTCRKTETLGCTFFNLH